MTVQNLKIDQRYDVIKTLGGGLSGEVMLVSDHEGQKALKFLKKIQLNVSKDDALNNFKNEFSILKELNHPNISRILDFGFDQKLQKYYFTTEFIQGAEFHKACEGQSIEVLERLIVQVLRALNYLHSRGIYHFDIKPQNVLITMKEGHPIDSKIIDFGLAGFASPRKKVGTPAYMAPEVIQGAPLDGRTDLYSFGVLIYKVLTGNNPFASKSLKETLDNQVNLKVPPPSQINPQVPKYWDHIVTRLLEKNPVNRYSQASLVIRDLNFLSDKKFEVETKDTKLSYLPEKGTLIGREKEWQVFTQVFGQIFLSDKLPDEKLLIIEGAKGTGKSRLLSEIKYFSQLRNVPVKTLRQFQSEERVDSFILMIDENQTDANQVNILQQELRQMSTLIVWATEKAPHNWANCQVITLTPYNKTQLKQYIESVTGLSHAPAKIIDEVFSRTQGNPLFVTEFIKSLLEQDLLFDASGKWDATTFEDIEIDFSKINIPNSVEDYLNHRYEKLSVAHQSILKWLAVNHEPLGLNQLEELCGKGNIASDILNLINDDILEKTTREHTYYFKNLLFVDLIYKLIAPQEKAACHDKLALIFGSGDLPKETHKKPYLFHTGHGSNQKDALDALFHLADLFKEDVQYSNAIDTYQLFIQKSQGPLDGKLLMAHLKLCDIFVLTRNFSEGFQHLDDLKNKIEASPEKINNDNLLTVLHKLTDVSIKKLDFDKAENYCLEAQPHIGDSISAASFDLIFKNYLAYISLKRGDIDAAQKTYEKTHEIWEKNLSPEEKLKVENNRLMEIYLLKQEYQNAIKFCLQNIETLKGTKNKYLLAFNYYALGETYFRIVTAEKRKDHTELVQKSIFSFQNCEKIARETHNHSFIFRALNAIGNLYIRENNREQALESYKRAFAVASKTDEKINAAVVGYNIGSNYNNLNQLEDAYSYLVFTINTLENIENLAPSNLNVLYLAYNEICDIYIKKNEFPKAHGALEKSLKLFNQNPFLKSFEYWNHIWRAKVYFFENKKPEFEEHLELAKQLAKTDEEKTDLAQELKIFDKAEAAKNAPKSEGVKIMNANQTSTINANEDLKRIIEINKFINSEFDAEQLLKLVLNCAIQLSNAESGFVLLLAEDGSFEIKSSMNTKDDDAEKISMSIARLAIEKGEIISSSDALSDDRFDSSESIVLNELKSVICLPIRSKNKSIGVFYLDNRYRVHAFDNCNVALLNAFCDQVGIALENNHLINELMEARRKLEQQLKATSDELAEVKDILKSDSETYKTRYAYKQIITQSQPMQEIFKLLDKVTETNLAICLHGASGTGKELVAKALHYNNPLRAQKRFVAINCGAIPANLMESELFGHKAGSFTGATKDKKGLFEEANGGTLFLDEIGELDPLLQVKLLRVLQEGEVQRIGDGNVIKVDVRILSATHKNLADMVKQGVFREDLFYRLCQMKIDLPSLRERKEDIPVLAKHFIEKFRTQNKLSETIDIPPLFMKCLIEYDWPGNVRELENLISVACALREGNHLSLENIPPNYGIKQKAAALAAQIQIAENLADMGLAAKAVNIDENNVFDPNKTWEQYESIIIAKCYELNGKKKMPTSDTLDLSHSTVYKKIAELSLDDTSNALYAENFTYHTPSTMKDYILKVFAAALKFHDGHPYAAIRQLGVSQGYFYKMMKEFRAIEDNNELTT